MASGIFQEYSVAPDSKFGVIAYANQEGAGDSIKYTHPIEIYEIPRDVQKLIDLDSLPKPPSGAVDLRGSVRRGGDLRASRWLRADTSLQDHLMKTFKLHPPISDTVVMIFGNGKYVKGDGLYRDENQLRWNANGKGLTLEVNFFGASLHVPLNAADPN